MSTTATFAIIVTIAILGAATMVSIYDLTPAYSVKKSRYCYDIGFEGVFCFESNGDCKKSQAVDPSATSECRKQPLF